MNIKEKCSEFVITKNQNDKYNAIVESNRLQRQREENELIMEEVKRGLRY